MHKRKFTPISHDPHDPHEGWWTQKAPREAVDFLLSQPINDKAKNGRGDWLFIRLPNGNLCLAFFPRGEAYLATEQWRDI